MKIFNTVVKVVVALAAVAGAVYVVATYGDQIVAWAKKLLAKLPCQNCQCGCPCEGDCEDCNCEDECDTCECDCACDECACNDEPVAVEATAEASVDTAAEKPVAEEAPAEEVVIDENAVVADEADFEG